MSLAFLFTFFGAATCALLLFVGISPTQLPVIFCLGNIEIHITIRTVCSSFGFKFFDECLNAWNAACCSWHLVGRENMQTSHVSLKGFDIFLAYLLH